MPPPSKLTVLFVTSELYPLVKTGGLGDVSAGLPAALAELGVDIRILIPGYRTFLKQLKSKRRVALSSFSAAPSYFPDYQLLSSKVPDTGVPLLVIDSPPLYDVEGGPYQDSSGRDWPLNHMRFGLLSYVAAILGSERSPLRWRADLIHCNDWQAGLAPAYLHFTPGAKAVTVQTIHNLAFQGIFPTATLPWLGLPPESFNVNGIEYYGNVSFLKAGLFYADYITTVSPTYAQEIQQDALGMGLQGLLATRRHELFGILNGIDTALWNPRTDSHLTRQYDSSELVGKAPNKAALQQRMKLKQDPDIPLLGIVTRLTEQKGIDLLIEALPHLLTLPAQVVVLGSGDGAHERALTTLASTYPDAVSVHIGFDEILAHLITAGCDIFLMPSRFEPCGLNQMYSQRYGTPPLVHATGGLADSVTDATPSTLNDATATGFQFKVMHAADFFSTVQRAVQLYRSKPAWQAIQRSAMERDFGWGQSAQRYLSVYHSLVKT
jgi:starch synthase